MCPTGFALAKDSFKMTAEEFLLEATLNTAVKAENFFPINGKKLFKGMENNNAEALIHEFGNRTRSFMDQKGTSCELSSDQTKEQEKAIEKSFTRQMDLNCIFFTVQLFGAGPPDSGVTVKGLRTTWGICSNR